MSLPTVQAPVPAAPLGADVAPPAQPSRSGLALRALGLAGGAGLFAYTLRDLDVSRLGEILRELGPLAALVLVPQALGQASHTWAWKEVLAGLRQRAPFFALLSVFLGSEAARMALPAGAALGESVAAYGIKSRLGVPWEPSLASLAAKKAWVLATHALCLVLMLAFAQAPLRVLAHALPLGWALTLVAWGMTAGLVLSAVVTLLVLASPGASAALARLARRLPFAAARSWGEARAGAASSLASLGVRGHALAAVGMFGQWLTEVFETWLVARLLGLPLSFEAALVIELAGALVRSLAFMVPGGLGVQDASYAGLLVALGLPGAEAAAPAFILLKRAKDLAYVALGLTCFALDRRRRSHVSTPVVLAAPPQRVEP